MTHPTRTQAYNDTLIAALNEALDDTVLTMEEDGVTYPHCEGYYNVDEVLTVCCEKYNYEVTTEVWKELSGYSWAEYKNLLDPEEV